MDITLVLSINALNKVGELVNDFVYEFKKLIGDFLFYFSSKDIIVITGIK